MPFESDGNSKGRQEETLGCFRGVERELKVKIDGLPATRFYLSMMIDGIGRTTTKARKLSRVKRM